MITKRFIQGAASVVTAGALLVGGTFAYFTDSQTSTGNTLGAGTLNIELNELGGTDGDYVPLNVTNLAPGGDSTFKCAMVKNAGTLPFEWTMKGTEASASTPSLSDVLWGRTYKWTDTENAPVDCSANANWELVGGAFGTLPVSAVLDAEAKQGELAADEEVYFRFEYFLPAELTTQPGNVDVPDESVYMGATTQLDMMVKAYQTNDPAYDALP